MKIQPILLTFFMTIGLMSCQSSENNSKQIDLNAEFESTSNSYVNSIKSVNADSVIAYWANDLHIYRRSSDDIVGKKAFKEILDSLYQGVEIPDISVISREMGVGDNLAVEVVKYSETKIKNGGEPQNINGKYLMVWIRIGDVWKISKMISLPADEEQIHEK